MIKKISILAIILAGSPLLVFAQVSPMNDTSSTALVSNAVFQEIVTLPVFILQKYETPLVGMAIIITLFFAIFGMLRWLTIL